MKKSSQTINNIIKASEDYRNNILDGYFADGNCPVHPKLLAARLKRAVIGQRDIRACKAFRYGIWANTVRSHVLEAISLVDKEPEKAVDFLKMVANTLGAFCHIQGHFEKLSDPDLYSFQYTEKGFCDVSINLGKLFKNDIQVKKFYRRFEHFINSDISNREVFYTATVESIRKNNNILSYKTESILPEKKTGKPKVLFILGNPASHSVNAGIFFAHQNNKSKSEHLFWRVLREIGFIDLQVPPNHSLSHPASVQKRKNDLYNWNYVSPFQISLDVFFTIPSGAKQGVDKPGEKNMGILQLFTPEAADKIAQAEMNRLKPIIENHDAVIVFQKDSYKFLRSADSQEYDWDILKCEGIIGKTFFGKDLYYSPPTPLINYPNTKRILKNFKERIELNH